ncbi:unnamed protein product [Euphydryas editha]|uniref:Tc1-like transposase DDE domain-containing protein n=1 Tax=Euphydryas editha TaxID=104508 RepID=A0AAU9TRK4_EUPED|nr:unnamed protein product [Euphydryas editha]
MTEMVVPYLPEKSLVVMDNALYHSQPRSCKIPYHYDLNPIEKIWSLVKRRVADKNVAQEPEQIIELTAAAFASITAGDWRIQCDHVKNIEDQYFKNDQLIDEEMERFIICIQSDSEAESDHDTEFMDTSDSDCDMSGIKPINYLTFH